MIGADAGSVLDGLTGSGPLGRSLPGSHGSPFTAMACAQNALTPGRNQHNNPPQGQPRDRTVANYSKYSKGRGQRSEVRSQRSEVSGQWSVVRSLPSTISHLQSPTPRLRPSVFRISFWFLASGFRFFAPART